MIIIKIIKIIITKIKIIINDIITKIIITLEILLIRTMINPIIITIIFFENNNENEDEVYFDFTGSIKIIKIIKNLRKKIKKNIYIFIR